MRGYWVCAGSGCWLAAVTGSAQQDTAGPAEARTVIKPDAPGLAQNHRLILKDGTYQMVRKYEIVGDRVRYLSLERGGTGKNCPTTWWTGTRRANGSRTMLVRMRLEAASPAMKEAEEIDKEEAAERNEMKARMPEVAKGLELPDEDGVFVLDTYQGTPELVELVPSDLSLNQRNRKGLATLNPLAGQRATVELAGAHAKVHLHVNDPAIYLSLEGQDDVEQVLSHAVTVHDERREGSGQSQAWRALAKLRVCDREGGRAQGGEDHRRDPREPDGQGDAGAKT